MTLGDGGTLADHDGSLALIAQRAAEFVDADVVTVDLIAPGETKAVIEVAVGTGADDLRGHRFEVDEPTPISAVIAVGPTMAFPLSDSDAGTGTMTIVRKAGRPAFTDTDRHLASAFADSAGVALQLAASRDLHDHVIQQLFAIGLTLDGVASSLGPDAPAAKRLHDQVAGIDRTIRQIRSTIFELHTQTDGETTGISSSS